MTMSHPEHVSVQLISIIEMIVTQSLNTTKPIHFISFP